MNNDTNTNLQTFIRYLQDTANFMTSVDHSLTTAVSDNIKAKLKNLRLIVDELGDAKDFQFFTEQMRGISEEMLRLLDDMSDEFSVSEGGGIRISKAQASALQDATELSIIIQGYLAISNDSENVINVHYERMRKMELLKDLDLGTLEKVFTGLSQQSIDKLKMDIHKSTVTFNDIYGIDEITNGLKKHLKYTYSLAFSPQFDSYQFIMLTGPPGTGKTTLALAIATDHSDGEYYNLDTSVLNSGVVGETEKQITSLFNYVRNTNRNVTIVIDEIDNMLGIPGDPSFRTHMQTVKTTFQTLVDDNSKLRRNVVVVGMTNHFNQIDPVMYRRMTYTALVPPPTTEMLFNYLQTQITQNRNGKQLFSLSDTYRSDFNSLLKQNCDGKELTYTNANIKQMHKNSVTLAFGVLTTEFVIEQNKQTLAVIYGNKGDFNDVPNLRQSNQDLKPELILTNYEMFSRNNIDVFIIPPIECIAKARYLTNVLTKEEVNEYMVNNMVKSAMCVK